MKITGNITSRFIAMAALCLMLMTPTFLKAQHEEMAAKHIERMATFLDLTDEQVTQMKAMSSEMIENMKAIKMNDELDRDAKHAAMEELFENKKERMATILTPEQMAKVEEMHGKKGHHGMRGMHRMHHSHHGMHGEMGDEKHKAVREEVHAYMQENMFPVVKEKRKAFDEKLSAEDRETIAELRGKMEEHHGKMGMRRMKHGHHGHPGCEKGDKDEAACKAKKEDAEGMHDTMKGLIEKYDADLTKVMEELEPQHEQWMNDIHAIMKKHMGEDADHHPMKEHKKHGKHMKMMHQAMFLMMDPDAEEVPWIEESVEEATATIFPNPVDEVTNIGFKIQNGGTVKIEILDRDANVIKTLTEQNYEAGEHTLEANLSTLDHGLYFVRVSSKDGVITQRFVKR